MNTIETNKRGVFAFIILVIVMALSHTPSAFACPCPENPDPLTSLKQSTAVFSGRVLNIGEDGGLSPVTGTRMRKVYFRVNKAWKGIERIKISVNTEKNSAACGYAFSTGNEYLVYAYGEKGNLQVSLCSRTQKLIDVSSGELAALGKPTFLPEYEDWPPLNLISDYPISSVSALAVLAVLVIIYLLRKFKAAH
jgi:hypothetical protein